MLAELDEDAAVLLQNTQCPQGAPFMAGFDESTLLLYIVDLVLVAEGFAVAAAVSMVQSIFLYPSLSDIPLTR